MTPHNPFILADGKKPTCMEMLQVIIDGEANDEQQEYFKNHMDRCLPCFKSYDLDMAIKRLLKSKCCGGEAPVDLMEQIKTQINQITPS
ncbi:MAG TPA: mycothiol system anti-sigma-R factor [Cyclobacteriaceae bacterium]|jgi:mycothiol system anti-sigma-R factor|nr:mycothiol system anti-sigma-R factor [Cytophagales bacterium]HMR55758.1 mycothiol system anti-sigma-R factor [Cyclobacteriaceae bacterium]HRE67420.1 mycothiol system anti-sigma-R factor [Cyclobacteriaceae bacterium]HRF33443.1 mycothiol system anti-sigma-R factor [Cyclobacteriaceae bacterium]